MNTDLQIFQGEKIANRDLQKRIDEIDLSRVVNLPNYSITEDECVDYDVDYDDNNYCVLGFDWYLFYTVEDNTVFIDFVQSCNYEENLFKRSIEMLKCIKMLLLKYKDYSFNALLNEYSLPLYNILLKREMIIEQYREDDDDGKHVNVEFSVKCKKLK